MRSLYTPSCAQYIHLPTYPSNVNSPYNNLRIPAMIVFLKKSFRKIVVFEFLENLKIILE